MCARIAIAIPVSAMKVCAALTIRSKSRMERGNRLRAVPSLFRDIKLTKLSLLRQIRSQETFTLSKGLRSYGPFPAAPKYSGDLFARVYWKRSLAAVPILIPPQRFGGGEEGS